MRKLLFANLSRLAKSEVFRLCAGFMAAAGLFVSLKTSAEFPIDRVLFSYGLIIGLACAVFCGLFLGTEHSDGTLRNKLIVGHGKTAVYLANLLVCALAGFGLCIAFLLPMLTVGAARLSALQMGAGTALGLFGVTLALTAAFCAVYTLIAMSCRSKAVTAVACILCFLALLCLGAAVNSRLQEPEFTDSYITDIDGVGQMYSEPNPEHLSGAKRALYQFVLDILPGGQALQFAELSLVYPGRLPLYSLAVVLLTSAVGVWIFKKKNVN